MKKGVFGIFLLVLILFGLFLFNKLGGFNPVEFAIRDFPETELLGIYYKGTPDNEKLAEAFQTIQNIQMKNPGSGLYTLYYIEPAGKRDTMELFVGLESIFVLDEKNFTQKTIPNGKAIIAFIKKHRLVMPSPNSIKADIESYASSNGLTKPTQYIDRILGTSEVQVIAPIP